MISTHNLKKTATNIYGSIEIRNENLGNAGLMLAYRTWQENWELTSPGKG